MKVDIWEFINEKPHIGTEALHVMGLPGTGKSLLAMGVFRLCIKKGDKGLVHGDRFCEWRHYYNYRETFKKIRILIPQEMYPLDEHIAMIRIPTIAKNDMYKEDFSKLDITKHLEECDLVIVYDAPYDISSTAWLWVNIFRQCIGRYSMELVDKSITYLCHESGVYWPEVALSESKLAKNHWWAVNTFAELFVYFRKALIRPILVSQLESEIKWQIRHKCMYKVFKQGETAGASPRPLRRATAKLLINQFNLQVGGPQGLYQRWVPVSKFTESKEVWKMIPKTLLTFGDKEHNGKKIKRFGYCINKKCGKAWKPRKNKPKYCPFCRVKWNSVRIFEEKDDDDERWSTAQ